MSAFIAQLLPTWQALPRAASVDSPPGAGLLSFELLPSRQVMVFDLAPVGHLPGLWASQCLLATPSSVCASRFR
jgi:hypothetical protein